MKKYFYFEDSPYYNKYIIKVNVEELPFPNGTNGSYGVLIARVLNLSYCDYLRYARDRLGAELIGKNKKYVIPYFENNQTTKMFLDLLNTRMEFIMNEYNFPYDFVEENGEIKQIPFKEDENYD